MCKAIRPYARQHYFARSLKHPSTVAQLPHAYHDSCRVHITQLNQTRTIRALQCHLNVYLTAIPAKLRASRLCIRKHGRGKPYIMQCHSPHAIPPLWQRAQNVVATATRCTKQLCAVPGHPIIHDIGAKLSGGIPPIGGQEKHTS